MWNSSGDLLRTWRTHKAKMSLRELAAVTYVSKTTLSDWENDKVEPDLHILEQAYATGGTLEDLYIATNKVLPERWEWAHNYQIADNDRVGGPVWALLRPSLDSPNRIRAKIRWGLFGVTVDEPCTEDGIFITCRVSTPHPAAFIYFYESPGWANFGRGKLPTQELGVVARSELRIIDAVEVSESVRRLVREGLRYMGRSFLWMLRNPDSREHREVEITKGLLRGGEGNREVHRATEMSPDQKIDEWHRFDHTEYLELRRKLKLSRESVVAIVNNQDNAAPRSGLAQSNALSAVPTLTVEQLKYFEESGGTSVPHLASRIDMAYRLDGHTCREEVHSLLVGEKEGILRATVRFPNHYVGPVVLTITNETETESEGALKLLWGPWQTSLIVASDRGVTCRKDKPGDMAPLEIEYPVGWTLKVEIGYNPDAISINNDIWDPRGIEAGASLVRKYVPHFTYLWNESKDEGRRLPWK